MRLAERLHLIKRVARALSEQMWDDIDLALQQAVLPTCSWDDEDRLGYCRWALRDASDDQLRELDDYLHSATHAVPADEPWQQGKLKLFITHVASHKTEATALKNRLFIYGIDSFVAHEDIEPAKPWQRVIEAALLSCNALVALLRTGFRESPWCDQEVGYALGRNLPIIPVAYDLQPYGFFGSLQSLGAGAYPAVQEPSQTPPLPVALANDIVRLLLRDPRTGRLLVEHMVDALVRSWSWDQSNTIAPLLASDTPVFTADHLQRLRKAQQSNIEVGKAFEVEPALRRLSEKFDISTAQ